MSLVLARSDIHGIGCFTTAPVPQGEPVAVWDDHDERFIRAEDVLRGERQLVETYCVQTLHGYVCPVTFTRMSVGWYLNHSDAPNLEQDGSGHMFAVRAIRAGEELTVDYATLDPDVDNSEGLIQDGPQETT